MFLLFEDLGFGELIVVGVASVLFFGKRLPEVAAQAGAQLSKFRRSLQDIKHETGMDHEMRKLQRTFEDARNELSMAEIARLAKTKVEQRLSEAKEQLDPGLVELEQPLMGAIPREAPPGAPAAESQTSTEPTKAPEPAPPESATPEQGQIDPSQTRTPPPNASA